MNKLQNRGYLADTSVFLRYLAGDNGLSEGVKAVFEDKNALIYVSAASFFEIAVKKALKKARLPDDLPQTLEQKGFLPLPIQPHHAWKTLRLPYHHSDPYDRLLAAQAVCENLVLLTGCPYFDAYDIPVMRA